MKIKLLVLLSVTLGIISQLAAPVSATAQYSQNIVGYINLVIQPGNNFIANQLSGPGNNNTLSNILQGSFQGGVPQGTTFTKWSASQLQFLPLATYDQTTGWSINYDLTFGEGGLLHTSSAFTNTFVGTVWTGWNGQYPFNTPLVSGSGVFLLACYLPLGNATFFDVVGRAPEDGDYVKTFNALTQLETITTYNGNTDTWNHGVPLLAVGQSAFFGLGVGPAPEPASTALVGVGVLVLAGLRRQRRK